MKSFSIKMSDSVLNDLKMRLTRTRWIDEVEDKDWYYGIPLDFMRRLVTYWKEDFDWRVQEAYINSFPNYLIDIDSVNVHFVHVRSRHPNAMPIILTHGWPSTFFEMLPLASLLADPVLSGGSPHDAFDVVIPSVPGHGFSDKVATRGFADRHVAALWVKLMTALGYEQFGAHGYDLGASITGLLCLDYPQNIIGYHTTSPANPAPYLPANAVLTAAEVQFRKVLETWQREEGGYAHLLGTRPQTVSYSLNDSPAGLAAWIIEKWYFWTLPPTGNLEEHFSLDQLITTVMIYWLTETTYSSSRYYREEVKWPEEGELIGVPVGVALTGTQAYERPPREYVERIYSDIRYWNDLGYGGHFVAMEAPLSIAESIRSFFRPLRSSEKLNH